MTAEEAARIMMNGGTVEAADWMHRKAIASVYLTANEKWRLDFIDGDANLAQNVVGTDLEGNSITGWHKKPELPDVLPAGASETASWATQAYFDRRIIPRICKNGIPLFCVYGNAGAVSSSGQYSYCQYEELEFYRNDIKHKTVYQYIYSPPTATNPTISTGISGALCWVRATMRYSQPYTYLIYEDGEETQRTDRTINAQALATIYFLYRNGLSGQGEWNIDAFPMPTNDIEELITDLTNEYKEG